MGDALPLHSAKQKGINEPWNVRLTEEAGENDDCGGWDYRVQRDPGKVLIILRRRGRRMWGQRLGNNSRGRFARPRINTANEPMEFTFEIAVEDDDASI